MTRDSLPTLPESTDAQSRPLISPCLTILCHPLVSRVGERCVLAGPLSLDRHHPEFFDPTSAQKGSRPLLDQHLSRQPIHFRPVDGGVEIDAGEVKTSLVVDGERLEGERRIVLGGDRVDRGVVLLIARRLVLLLHHVRPSSPVPAIDGLIGESPAMAELRREIRRVADLPFPILLRGESGTGKELVARAIHEVGPRREGPYLAVNLAAIPPTLASAELFGAAKGAYSGARQRRVGYFERAARGTLLLDEIGEATPEVQVLLLRALESSQVQPLGAETPLTVDVRVLAATDADLDAAVERGEFRSPLLHRLANYEIHLPPLRRRLDDFGRLFFHFLDQELSALGRRDLLQRSGGKPWFDIPLVADLARYTWPGNVRQLRNVVRQLVVGSRDAERMEVPVRIQDLLRGCLTSADRGGAPATSPRPRTTSFRDPVDVDEKQVRRALEAEDFEVRAAAERLRISRPSLYALMKKFGLPLASDLPRAQLLEALAGHDGDLAALARSLKVSAQGLKQHLRRLELL